MRIGGQADVLVYTGDNPLMNLLGALYIRVVELALLPLLSSDMTRGDKAALRLTIGLGLAVLVAYGLALHGALRRLRDGGARAVQAGAAAAAGQGRSSSRCVFAALVAAGVLMVPLLEHYAAAGVLLTAVVLFALFYIGLAARQPADHGAGAGLHADPGGRRRRAGAGRRAQP